MDLTTDNVVGSLSLARATTTMRIQMVFTNMDVR